MTINAFKAWAEKYTCKNYPVVVFEYTKPYWDRYNDDIYLSKQEDIADIADRYFQEEPFESYPEYECCDVSQLVAEQNILVNIRREMYFASHSYVTTLDAYVPFKNQYHKIRFGYEFCQYLIQIPKISGIDWRQIWLATHICLYLRMVCTQNIF